MTTTELHPGTPSAPPSPASTGWQQMRVWAAAHTVDDFYQGLIPAAIPFFVLDRHFSYLAASALALAMTLGSALPQIGIGLIADRHRVRWLSPFGMGMAGVCGGLAGLAPSFPLVFALIALSGLRIAMFHPPAGQEARRAAKGSATAMSYFAAGGSVGFFLGPALATPALDNLGVGATVVFILPAVVMGLVLLRHQQRSPAGPTGRQAMPGQDRPRLFAALTCVEVIRSTISYGVNTFVALYWIRHLGASSALGGVALTLELGGGVLGTLAGGRIADRFGMVRTVQLGNALLLPALIALLCCPDKYGALPLVFIVGLITNIPFAVLVKLGQDYLPSRPGTAAGVTLGLAISAGGLLMPVLGLVADHHGPQGAFLVLAAIPVIAVTISTLLREPHPTEPVPSGSPT